MVKQLLITNFLALLFFVTANAQTTGIYNNGAILQINNNTVLQVNGDIVNTASSNFTNNGTVIIKENFINNQLMTSHANGLIEFSGTAKQFVLGTEPLLVKHINFNNTNGVEINNTLKIDGECKFINGVVLASSSITPTLFTVNGFVSSSGIASNNSHVNGYVVKEGTGSFTYPVGDGVRYQKVIVNLTNNTQGMQVKYEPTDAGNIPPFGTNGTDPVRLSWYNNKEYWDISPLDVATGTVTIFWDDYKNTDTIIPANMRVAHLFGGQWSNEGTVGVGTIAAGSVTSNVLNNWSPFTLGRIPSSILPLRLLSFTGNKTANGNLLSWQTTNEVNTKEFELQKSRSTNFNKVATIQARGNGNGTYNYNDAVDIEGTNFYRLKMIDNNGYFTYSTIVRLSNEADNQINIYPNPVQSKTTLQISNKWIGTTARLIDMQGKLISSIVLTNNFTVIDMAKFASGVYMLQLKDDATQKIIKE
jgi:Secretion system C-terminal sorting domain